MRYARLNILLGVLMSVLAAGCVGCAHSQAGKSMAQWQVVIPGTLFAEKLRVAAFLDNNFGVNGGAGDIGKARYTFDGGKTWNQAESSGG